MSLFHSRAWSSDRNRTHTCLPSQYRVDCAIFRVDVRGFRPPQWLSSIDSERQSVPTLNRAVFKFLSPDIGNDIVDILRS